MIRRLLVANRGEIARRVFATCRRLGIETVAVFADADANAPHTREADYAVRLPGNAPVDTYLRIDLIIEAARRSGADAIHPGYGFLAENAEFASAVLDAGLTWVGPAPRAILVMGSKLESKALLREAGVPMLPSWTEPAQVTDFPVLVKASAGGGGRGMRVVRAADALAEALASAGHEAARAFGDGAVFCERYVEDGRHIEVQVFGDSHGTIVALGERECSIQRRHQKIVEESPSAALNDATREEMCAAAIAAARAVDYVGAGTVEFLLAPDGAFYFLEMNTRLQVEHPVTECVTGLDLVELQLIVAQGRPLPFSTPPTPRGHAIEVRLYAEDPAQDWRASTGTLHHFAVAAHGSEFTMPIGAGIRVDSGVTDGVEVSSFYDPMLAKVIAWAPERSDAARLLAASLARAQIHGVRTNRDLLMHVLRSKAFLDGDTDTSFLARHREVFDGLLTPTDRALGCLSAALASSAQRRAVAPWAALPSGWRNVASMPQTVCYTIDARTVEVTYHLDRDGRLNTWSVRDVDDADGSESFVDNQGATVDCTVLSPHEVVLVVDGLRLSYRVERQGETSYVDCSAGSLTLVEAPRFPAPESLRVAGSLLAPMPASVGRVMVKVGDLVTDGELLMTLEAMKLEHPVYAPHPGTVAGLTVEPGDQVETGTVLAIITPSEDQT